MASVSPVTTIILVRHGETDWNRDGIWQGHGDPPLNATGRAQAAATAERLARMPVDALYSSDLARAVETAAFLASATGVSVTLDAGLREMDVGSWTGLGADEIRARFGDTPYHDGETRDAFDARAVSTLHRIASGHRAGRIVVVSHGGVVRALQRHALGEPLPLLGNGEQYAMRYEAGRFMRVGNAD